MNTQPFKVEKFVTPEGHDHWLVGADGRAIARLIPNHPAAEEIAALLSSTPLLRAALQSMVAWYARRKADSNELLPEDEQPAEIREALAALQAASPNGAIPLLARPAAHQSSGHRGGQVPADLRAVVDDIGKDLKPGQHWSNVFQLSYLLTILKGRGGEGIIASDLDGNPNALAEFKIDGRTWLLWVEGDCCGVEPCISLAAAVLADSYGKSPIDAPDRYRWKHPESPT